MKGIVILCMLMFVNSPAIYGQIKIGDNPQNIDPASVLELESNSRVLVITKATTDQMNAISPQRGGLVFNTDTDCVHYYNGTQWINLCDAASFVITNDPIVNNRATIAITESTEGYNLEIAENSILGANIVDGGIGPDDIQDNSITVDKLSEDSVGSSELRDNSVGANELMTGAIQPFNMASTIADQVLSTDENGIVIWADASNLQGAVTDDNTISGNGTNADPIRLSDFTQQEIDTKELLLNKDANIELGNSDILYPTQNAVRTYVNNRINDVVVSGDGDSINEQNIIFEVANGNLEITDIDGTLEVPLSDLNNQTLSINAANQLSISNGNNVDLSPYLDNTDEQQLSINPAGTRISLTNGGFVDLPAGAAEVDGDITNELQDLAFDPLNNILTLTTPGTPGNQADLSSLAGGGISETLKDSIAFPRVLQENFILIGDNFGNADKRNIAIIPFTDLADATDSISMGNFRIKDLQNPTENQDAATKKYVDDNSSFTGTSGSILFVDTDGSIIENNNELFWDNANNRLGIGTKTPERTLEIAGETKSTSFSSAKGTANEPAYSFSTGDDSNTGMYRPYADQLGLVTDGVEAFRIGFNQNVGIGNFTPTGNTNPSSTLEIKGSFAANIRTDATNTVAILENDYTIIVATGATTITLPTPIGCQGRIYILKNTTGGPLTIDDYVNSDGTNTTSLDNGVTQLQSDGTDWQQIN